MRYKIFRLILFIGILIFCTYSGFCYGTKLQKDSVIILKSLPQYFEKFNLKEGIFFSRDQLLNMMSVSKQDINYIRNYFYLEDGYNNLNPEKNTRVFYIHFYVKNYSDSPGYNYLLNDLGDKTISIVAISEAPDSIKNKIYDGSFTQNKKVFWSKINFSKPIIQDFYKASREYELSSFSDLDYDKLLRLNNDSYDTILNLKNINFPQVDSPHKKSRSLDTSGPIESNFFALPSRFKRIDKYHNGDEYYDMGTGGPLSPLDFLSKISKDSLRLLETNMGQIMSTYKSFIKEKPQGDLLYRSFAQEEYGIFKNNIPFYSLKDLPKVLKRRGRKFIKIDKKYKSLFIVFNNYSILSDVKKNGGGKTGSQGSFKRTVRSVADVKLVYINKNRILEAPWDPFTTKPALIDNNLYDTIKSVLFKLRSNLVDQMNSLNYVNPELLKFKMPALILNLNETVLQDNIDLLDSEFKQKVYDSKLSYKLYNKIKLWVTTDIRKKTIYISPFLIRATFTQTLENSDLFDLAYDQKNLKDFFNTKSGYLGLNAIHNLYDKRAFDDYSTTVRFVVAHELAHIYLKDRITDNIEGLCDCYALYHLKKKFQNISLGVFEDFLIKSINQNVYRFWSSGSDKDNILKRYEFLKKYESRDKILFKSICEELAN